MILAIAIAAGGAVAVAATGAVMTRLDAWYYGLRKPWFQPPDWLFGPAWTVILGLSAWSGVLAWEAAPTPAARACVISMFAINGVLNVSWNILFFALKRPDWALVETAFLWLSLVALVVGLAPWSVTASLLIVPYLVWVSFASVLNLAIVRLNAPFGHPVSAGGNA